MHRPTHRRTRHLNFNTLPAFCFLLTPLTGHTQSTSEPPSTATYRIAGHVLSALDAHPLARASVTLRDQSTRNPVATVSAAPDGTFAFPELKAGKYTLNGRARGFLPAALDQHEQFSTAVVTGPDFDTSSLTLRLAPEAVITGRVLDEAGDPVRNANLALYREAHNTGTVRIARFRNANTNDLGEYELTGLAPGTYFLSVNAQPWYAVHAHRLAPNPNQPTGSVDPALDVVYPLTFYPGATDSAGASPISLKGAERVHLDLHLIPQPAVTLRIHGSADAIGYPQLQRKVFDTFEPIQGDIRNDGGEFEIGGLPQGSVELRSVRNGRGGNSASRTVTLTRGNNELNALTASEDPAKLAITLQSEDGTGLPQQMQVTLRNGDGPPTSARRAKEESAFRFETLAPATYTVNVSGGGRLYRVTRALANGKELPSTSLAVTPASNQAITLVVNGSQTAIQGLAWRNGKPAPGSMVVLVPVDPDAPRTLFRRDQSDGDGSFTLLAVPNGRYILVAIDDGWTLDWARPQILAPYLLKGIPVAVTGKEGSTLKLPTPIAAQSR